MSQPAQITAESDWNRLLLAVEDLTRAATQTLLDIVEFHREKRPVRGQPKPDTHIDHQPSHAPRDVEERDTPPEDRDTSPDDRDTPSDDRDDSRTIEDQEQERREEEDQLQAQQDELDLEL